MFALIPVSFERHHQHPPTVRIGSLDMGTSSWGGAGRGSLVLGIAYGCGSKLTRRGYAGFGPCFHLPGFHCGTGFLSHSHILYFEDTTAPRLYQISTQ